MTVIELGVLTHDGDAPPPARPAHLRRRLIRRLVVTAVAVGTVLTVTGSGPPRPPYVRTLWGTSFSDGDAMSLDATTVYTSREQDGRHTLTAYDLATGRVRWSVPASEGGFSQAPVAGDVLMAPGHLADFRFPLPDGTTQDQSYVTSTVARDTTTGRTLWTAAGDALRTFGDSALLGENDNRGRLARLRVVGLRDGVTRWTRPVPGVEAWTLAQVDGGPARIVLTDADGRLTVLDYADGSTVRTGRVSLPGPLPADDSYFAGLAVHGNALIVARSGRSSSASTVYRLDTLQALWTTDAFLSDCGAVLCTMEDRTGLIAHDPASGAVRWRRSDLGGYFARLGDRILASGSSALGPWQVVDPATGRDIGGSVQGQPTWVGDQLRDPALLVGTVADNYRLNSVIQLDLSTGTSFPLGTIPQAPAFDCQSTPGYLVCGGPGRLAITAVG